MTKNFISSFVKDNQNMTSLGQAWPSLSQVFTRIKDLCKLASILHKPSLAWLGFSCKILAKLSLR